jgi:hypothetical protein
MKRSYYNLFGGEPTFAPLALGKGEPPDNPKQTSNKVL